MNRPWMPLYVADYLADTAHLSAAESGAYLHLIMHYWQRGHLLDDDVVLARIAKMSAVEWAEARPVIADLFEPGWKHKRIEFELTEAARISEAGRRGGKASGAARKQKKSSSEPTTPNDRSTIVQRSDQRFANDQPNDSRTICEALQSQKKKYSEEPNGSSGAGAPPKPVYTDSRHELWGEAVPIVMSFGYGDRAARALIGSWLKQAKDDAQIVLGAIQRARDHRPNGVVAWITAAIRPRGKSDVAESRSLVAAVARAADNLSGTPGMGHGTGAPLLRLVPEGGSG